MRSTFENVYVIEADSASEAVFNILNEVDNPPDFFQKHLGESATSVTELVEGTPSKADIDIAKDNIKARGYV